MSKRGKGRQPKYRKSGPREKFDTLKILDRLDQVEKWYREGKDDEEVASLLGVSVRTLYNWCERALGVETQEEAIDRDFGGELRFDPEKYKPFYDARERGKQPSNERLEKTAYDLAVGDYVYEEVAIGWSEGSATEHRYKKKLPPNIQMLKLLLQNRMPDKYRDTRHIEHGGSMGVTQRILGDFSDEELAMMKQEVRDYIRNRGKSEQDQEVEGIEIPDDL